ncbi:MAG: hypothetical protein ABIP29_02185, partial [Candidatus Eisenbacteria bacterium]
MITRWNDRRALVAVAAAWSIGVGMLPAVVAPPGAQAAPEASYLQFTSINLGGDNSPGWSSDGQFVYYSTRLAGFPYIYRKAAGAPINLAGTRLTA